MNAALNRPALNVTILVSVIFHLAVLYYLAMTWNIIPPIVLQHVDHSAIQVYVPPPPPPIVDTRDLPPIVAPHHPIRVIDTPVPPVPLPPQHVDQDQPRGPLTLDHTILEQPTSFVKPLYPPIALTGEREGHVRLSITILPDGSVTDVQVVSAQPPGLFERSAIDAVKRWRYAPSGTTRTHVYVDIDYQLTG
jgi:TonB family protein